MKLKKWLLGILALFAAFGTAHAQQDETALYTNRPADVRACARESCAVRFSLPRAEHVIALETKSDDEGAEGWLLIRHADSGGEGYISADHVTARGPDAWKDRPIIPEATDAAREIYAKGRELGNDPHAFSKVGDCQSINPFFLWPLDQPKRHVLREGYEHLQGAIDQFAGSFERESQAVLTGFNARSILSPMFANPELCEETESPLECEDRIHNPSFAIISLETWWTGAKTSEFMQYQREIIDFWIARGVVPILATKADNREGGHKLNAAIEQLAWEYDLPLWNFWRAVQPLPNHGLQEDAFHLTLLTDYFDPAQTDEGGWPMRNLTALQTLDSVWRGVTEP